MRGTGNGGQCDANSLASSTVRLPLPGYPDTLLRPNATPRPRTLDPDPLLRRNWVPLWHFTEFEHILGCLIGPETEGLDQSQNTWVKQLFKNVSLALILWLETIQSMMALFCMRPMVTTNDFSDGSLRLNYVVNHRATEQFSMSCQAHTGLEPVILCFATHVTALNNLPTGYATQNISKLYYYHHIINIKGHGQLWGGGFILQVFNCFPELLG